MLPHEIYEHFEQRLIERAINGDVNTQFFWGRQSAVCEKRSQHLLQ